jgi:alpha-L-fucosidase
MLAVLASGTHADVPDWLQRAVDCRPAPRQMAWQQLEFNAFCHFGVNTFTGREWGTGEEPESTFNPTACDPEQWVLTAQAAGEKMIVLTAKHHDGFCLWPTHFSEHCVRHSPWLGGQGDVVGLLAAACRKHGLKMGLYLSPADLNAIHIGVYKGGQPKMHRVIPTPVPGWTPKSEQRFEGDWDPYNTFYLNQLYELLTEYGEIGEVWFDGANPHPGTGQTYDYQAWYHLIRTLQPNACIFGMGPDIRWVGNEGGGSRPAEWSPIPVDGPGDAFHGGDMTAGDLGSRERLKNAKFVHWYPAETDVPIRHGWFYRDEQQGSRGLDELLDIWYRAVGGNSVLLLNMSPDRRGLIPDHDVQTLHELGDVLRVTFAANLAAGALVETSAARDGHGPERLVDAVAGAYWMPPDGTAAADVTLTLPAARTFNRLVLQEAIAEQGQRVEQHVIEAWVDGAWHELGHGQTIGYKRIHRFPAVTTGRVRVRVTASRVAPTLSFLGLYREPARPVAPTFQRSRDGQLAISGGAAEARVVYTLDGTDPTAQSPLYTTPIALPKGGLVRACVLLDGRLGPLGEQRFGVAKAKWKVIDCDSFEPGNPPSNAIDDDPTTVWHTEWRLHKPKHAHWVSVSLGETLDITGFSYLPRPGSPGPHIEQYAIYVSADGQDWGRPVAQGKFGNIVNNPVEQFVMLGQPVRAAFFKFVALSQPNGHEEASAAEFGVLAK